MFYALLSIFSKVAPCQREVKSRFPQLLNIPLLLLLLLLSMNRIISIIIPDEKQNKGRYGAQSLSKQCVSLKTTTRRDT